MFHLIIFKLPQIQRLRSLYEKRRNKISDDDEEGSWGLWSEEENEEVGVTEKYLRENNNEENEKQEIIEFLRMQSIDNEHGSNSSILASPADKNCCHLPVEAGFLDESCSPSSWWN